MTLRRRRALGAARQGRRERPYSQRAKRTGATEDTAWRRPSADPAAQGFVLKRVLRAAPASVGVCRELESRRDGLLEQDRRAAAVRVDRDGGHEPAHEPEAQA